MDNIKTLAGLLLRDKSKNMKSHQYGFYFQGICDLIELIEKTENVKNINPTLSTDEYLTYNSQSDQDEYAEGLSEISDQDEYFEGGGYNGFEGGK